MLSTTRYKDYDPFARIYNDYWSEPLLEEAEPVLEKLLFPNLPKNAKVLDLCCGTGQVTNYLLKQGYQVTGLDGSEEMLRYARDNAKTAQFILEDARFFSTLSSFDGVVSTSGSFNYILQLEELEKVFRQVYSSLLPNGIFVFNLYMKEEFETDWNFSVSGDIQDDYAWAVRHFYDAAEKQAELKITIFHLVEQTWQRLDTTLQEKCYTGTEIETALKAVGFVEISVYDAYQDFGVHDKAGSAYFVCRKMC